MDYTKITLGELLSHANQIIKRNAISILKQLQKEEEKCPSCGKIPDLFGRCKCCNKDAF